MTPRPIQPAPWRVVALAVVPGLLAVLAATFPGMPIAGFLALVIALGVAGLFLAWRARTLAAFPAWGLVPLGLVFFGVLIWPVGLVAAGSELVVLGLAAAVLVLAAARVYRRERPGRPPAASLALAAVGLVAYAVLGHYGYGFLADYSWLLLALPAAAGLILAPTHGLPAALVLLTYGTFIMSFDVEHVIYFREARAWSDVIRTAMPLLLLVLLPLWVLRARSLAGQAVGLVVPGALFYLLLVVGLAAASDIAPDWEHGVRIARPVARLLAILALSGAVYGWLRRGAAPAMAGGPVPDEGCSPHEPQLSGQ